MAMNHLGQFVSYGVVMGLIRQILYEFSSRELSIYTTAFLCVVWSLMCAYGMCIEYRKRSAIVLDYVFHSSGALFWGIVFLYLPL